MHALNTDTGIRSRRSRAFTSCLFVSGLLISGCSNHALYDNLQTNHKNHCYKLPTSEQQDCLSRSDQSYREYQQERNSKNP